MTIATSLERIDPAWLGAVLGAEVIDVTAEPLAFEGSSTDMARIRVSYDEGSDGPRSMIAKVRGRDELRQHIDAVLHLFARESRFYAQIAPEIPVRTPRAIHVGDGIDTPLLLEDLGDLRAGDQSQGMQIEDAERTIDALAEMHARYWKAELLAQDWLARPTSGGYKDMVAQLMLSGASILAERYSGILPDDQLDHVATAAPHFATYLERMDEGPHTLVHNDCRQDNMFFDFDDTPVFVDWQLLADTRASQDLATLLAGGLEIDDLSTHWQRLLRRYHDRLTAHGINDYSHDQLIHHYRQNVLFALGQGMALLGTMGGRDTRNIGDKIVRRALAHATEIGTFAALEPVTT